MNDGTIPFGTRVIAVYRKAPSYAKLADFTCEAFEPTRPSQTLRRYNHQQAPSGSVSNADFITGTAVLQIADDTKIPKTGDVFAEKIGDDSTATQFYLTEVGYPESNGSDKKVRVSFMQLITTVTLP